MVVHLHRQPRACSYTAKHCQLSGAGSELPPAHSRVDGSAVKSQPWKICCPFRLAGSTMTTKHEMIKLCIANYHREMTYLINYK